MEFRTEHYPDKKIRRSIQAKFDPRTVNRVSIAAK